MSQENSTTEVKKSKHLSYSDRQKIELYYKEKYSAKDISIRLKKSKITIEREIKIGLVELLNSDLSRRTEYATDRAKRYMKKDGARKEQGLR